MKWGKAVIMLMAGLLTYLPASGHEQISDDAQFGKFDIMANITVEMSVSYDGSDLKDMEDSFTRVDYDPVLQDIPLAGWRTFKVNMFTGGANCCMAYYLLSESEDKAAAAYLPPNDQHMSLEKGGRLSVSDPYFMYYTPEFSKEIMLTRPESPRLSRLLLFEDNQWRVDKPGEFPEVYKQWLQALAEAEDTAPSLARDITAAYYMIMAGRDNAEIEARFMRNPAYREVYPLILRDIEKAVNDFNPLRNLRLSSD